MKKKHLLLGAPLLLALPCCVSTPKATPPTSFLDGVKLEADGATIDIEVGHLVPYAVDWNADDKKDLILGQFSGGKVRLYLNQGTDGEPRLAESSFLEAGGAQISLPAG